ncbi:unnamed protein product [Prorocentrum cordatum]|uniref:Uncharacterized protein n=1 Tax=Prorocentrum cordatum TaxID=2364126 RepID=A0ABN9XXS4_9DINO|nr:unnamed protein product [Polarella glacialis]
MDCTSLVGGQGPSEPLARGSGRLPAAVRDGFPAAPETPSTSLLRLVDDGAQRAEATPSPEGATAGARPLFAPAAKQGRRRRRRRRGARATQGRTGRGPA